MDEYIERDSVLKAIDEIYEPVLPNFPLSVTLNQIDIALGTIPAADVAPVRHGMWLNFYGDFSTAECELCSELYEVSPDESPKKEFFDAFKGFYKFCPNCGTKMDEEATPCE